MTRSAIALPAAALVAALAVGSCLLRADVSGTLMLVDHSILRATDKGALGMLEISGPIHTDIFDGTRSGHLTH